MIKTEFFDDSYNKVEESTAEIIVQSIFDKDGNLQKKIEWTPKKKTGYSRTTQVNDDIRYEFLSQDVKNHYLDNVLGIQRAIDLLWRYHSQEESISQKRKILSSILNGYSKINFAIMSFDHELKREKGGSGY
ncbi:hypothetical protein C6990_05825 [Nitrosopumilus sp. b3]|uniref:hypothetical protein n=1 Tax=Nitrosopumilus sp. b3 TaxID=2109909 RepID=UPI0015F6BA80|nr:hypothetical protein [Nitrosopumilus sp. b3]KAF6247190.1 hypothetical protein C6990_05825 [Nitrosopumilus sp. b3]